MFMKSGRMFQDLLSRPANNQEDAANAMNADILGFETPYCNA